MGNKTGGNKQKLTDSHMVVTRGKREEEGKGAKYMVMEGGLTGWPAHDATHR